jgi:hypothetical protein
LGGGAIGLLLDEEQAAEITRSESQGAILLT